MAMAALSGLVALGSLTACNNAKSPDTAARDIAAADRAAAAKIADAQRDAQKDMSGDAYNVALAQGGRRSQGRDPEMRDAARSRSAGLQGSGGCRLRGGEGECQGREGRADTRKRRASRRGCVPSGGPRAR